MKRYERIKYDMTDIGDDFQELLALSEAAEIWGLEESTIRKAISQGRLVDGRDCRKFGKQWVITVEAMARVFTHTDARNWTPWSNYITACKAAERERKNS